MKAKYKGNSKFTSSSSERESAADMFDSELAGLRKEQDVGDIFRTKTLKTSCRVKDIVSLETHTQTAPTGVYTLHCSDIIMFTSSL